MDGDRPWDLGVINKIPSVLWEDGILPLLDLTKSRASQANQVLIQQLQRGGDRTLRWFTPSLRYQSWCSTFISDFRKVYVSSVAWVTSMCMQKSWHALTAWICYVLNSSASCSLLSVDALLFHTYWFSVNLVHTYTGWDGNSLLLLGSTIWL